MDFQDCGILEIIEAGSMSSAERSLRHGQLKQLKDLRRFVLNVFIFN